MHPHWTQHTVTVNGASIHYTRTGDGSKPAMVLAHGFSDSGPCFSGVAEILEADYDLILPDARGHGRSARVQPGEMIDLSTDLAGFIQALGLQRPIVGGHSMGADTAAQMGARFPTLARALLLEDPPWFAAVPDQTNTRPARSPMPDWLAPLLTMNIKDLVAKCRADSPTYPEADVRPWAKSKLQFDPNFLHRPPSPHQHWAEIAAALRCPTLLLIAKPGNGGLVTREIAQQAISLNPLIKVAEIDNAGHSIRRDNRDDYIAVVKGFLLTL